jgi:PIN domain nuclease of toxin-antitoxin system
VILLDTHIWFWWCENNPRLGARALWLDAQPESSLVISVITIWEIAKLVSGGRVLLPVPPRQWIDGNLKGTGTGVIPLSKDIALETNSLPPSFHRAPTDQIIVATARLLDCELLTADAKILSYPHVKAVAP